MEVKEGNARTSEIGDEIHQFDLGRLDKVILSDQAQPAQGQAAVTASIDFTLANHIAAMILLGSGKVLTHSQLLGVYAGRMLQSLFRMCVSRWGYELHSA